MEDKLLLRQGPVPKRTLVKYYILAAVLLGQYRTCVGIGQGIAGEGQELDIRGALTEKLADVQIIQDSLLIYINYTPIIEHLNIVHDIKQHITHEMELILKKSDNRQPIKSTKQNFTQIINQASRKKISTNWEGYREPSYTPIRLKHIIQLLDNLDPGIHAKEGRTKRAILPFVGDILSTLFGTATDTHLSDVESNVSKLKTWASRVNIIIRDEAQGINKLGSLVSDLRTLLNRRTEQLKDSLGKSKTCILVKLLL